MSMDKDVIKQLQECNTIGEMFKVLNQEYETENCSVKGFATKTLIIAGFQQAFNSLNPKRRKL